MRAAGLEGDVFRPLRSVPPPRLREQIPARSLSVIRFDDLELDALAPDRVGYPSVLGDDGFAHDDPFAHPELFRDDDVLLQDGDRERSVGQRFDLARVGLVRVNMFDVSVLDSACERLIEGNLVYTACDIQRPRNERRLDS